MRLKLCADWNFDCAQALKNIAYFGGWLNGSEDSHAWSPWQPLAECCHFKMAALAMSEKEERAKRFMLRALSLMPGFKSYSEKESLRKNDYLLRLSCTKALNSLIDALNTPKQKALGENDSSMVLKIDRLQTKIRLAADKTQLRQHGYSAVFDKTAVDQELLSKIIGNDEAMLGIIEQANSIEESNGPVAADITKASELIDRLDKILKARDRLLA